MRSRTWTARLLFGAYSTACPSLRFTSKRTAACVFAGEGHFITAWERMVVGWMFVRERRERRKLLKKHISNSYGWLL